jgi:hypothetical protein
VYRKMNAVRKWADSKNPDGHYQFGDLWFKGFVKRFITNDFDDSRDDYENENQYYDAKSLATGDGLPFPTEEVAKPVLPEVASTVEQAAAVQSTQETMFDTPDQLIFYDTVFSILSGGQITKEQLECLWDASELLTAEQSASVFGKVITSFSTSTAHESKSEDAIAVSLMRLAKAVDVILDGKVLTSPQFNHIRKITETLSAKEVVQVLQERFTIHWAKRRQAFDEYRAAFSNAVRVTLNKKKAGGNVDGDLLTLVGYSSFLPTKDVHEILASLHTSWTDLSSENTAAVAVFAEARPVDQLGVKPTKPPQPPPPSEPRPSKVASGGATVATAPVLPRPGASMTDLLAAIQNPKKLKSVKAEGEIPVAKAGGLSMQEELKLAFNKFRPKVAADDTEGAVAPSEWNDD